VVPEARKVNAGIERLAPKARRVFGALRGVIHVDPSFFEPLPVAELNAWSGTSKTRRLPNTRTMLAAALRAFWAIADDLSLTTREQSALLAVSTRTLARWKAKAPAKRVRTLDRLVLILPTYVRIVDTFAHVLAYNDELLVWYVRFPGTADNPAAPAQSVLGALSDRSVLEMLTHYRRLAESVARSPLAADSISENAP
jgi:hypothetical protein